jgi:hypothetical protein
MTSPACFALFCEDIRREAGSLDTLIGVMPSTQRVPTVPGAFRRLSVYYRIRLPLDQDINERISASLDIDEGVVGPEVEFSDDGGLPKINLERAVQRAKILKAAYVEVHARIRLDELPIVGPGQIRAIAKVGHQTVVGGYLNIELRDDSNASQPPS